MADGYLIDREFLRKLRQMYADWERSRSFSKTATLQNEKTPIYFKNVSGETIPPYACMQVTGTEEEGPQNFLEVDKPADTDGTAGQFLFNNHSEVLSGDAGVAQDCAVVRAFKNSGTVTAGDVWGPTVGQWYLTKDSGSYVAAGEDDIATNVFRVFVNVGASGGTLLAVTPVGGIPARTDNTLPITFPSATCNKIDPSTGNYFSPNQTVVVYNMVNLAVNAQSLIQAKKIGDKWFVDVDNCDNNVLIALPTEPV